MQCGWTAAARLSVCLLSCTGRVCPAWVPQLLCSPCLGRGGRVSARRMRAQAAVCCLLPSLFLTSLPVLAQMRARDVSHEQKQKRYPAAMVQCAVQHCACCLGELSSLKTSSWFQYPWLWDSFYMESTGSYSVHLECGKLVSKLWYVSLRAR